MTYFSFTIVLFVVLACFLLDGYRRKNNKLIIGILVFISAVSIFVTVQNFEPLKIGEPIKTVVVSIWFVLTLSLDSVAKKISQKESPDREIISSHGFLTALRKADVDNPQLSSSYRLLRKLLIIHTALLVTGLLIFGPS